MYAFQRKLQYHAENKGLTPESVGVVGASVETLTTPDGEKIIVWYAPATEGKPTILYLTAAYDWLLAKGITPQHIALLGESLGSGIAVQIASQKQVGAVALNAPYTSTADVAARIYWWLPVRALMKDQFRSINFISKVKAPLLIVHGEQDTLIPLEFGRRLFAAANEPKEMEIIRGFGHEAMFEEVAWAREVEFFARAMNRK
jgi:fermentation-respiration switch protein FrsA (DUF1100 family)